MAKRSNYSPEEKVKILQEVQINGVSKEEVCRKHGISKSLFDKWQAQAKAGMTEALRAKSPGRKPSNEAKKVKDLEKELQRKDHVIAELTSALLGEKKSFLDALKSLVSPGKKN
jgi:transposase-like protein